MSEKREKMTVEKALNDPELRKSMRKIVKNRVAGIKAVRLKQLPKKR